MATYPSSAAHTNTLLVGSCKIEYSNDSGVNWINLGIARGVTWKENFTKTLIQADNSANIADKLGEQTIDIGFTGLEFYLPTLYALRGIDTVTITAGARTTDTETYTTGRYAKGNVIWFPEQGATSVLPAVVKVRSVSTVNACTTYTATDDYQLITDTSVSPRKMGIALLAAGVGGDYKDTHGLILEWQYTAISSYKLKSGGLTTFNTKWFRLSNKEIVGGVPKYRYFTIYSGSIEEGLNLAFKSCNEADAILECPIMIKGRVDSTRSAGDQLYCIEDEVTHA